VVPGGGVVGVVGTAGEGVAAGAGAEVGGEVTGVVVVDGAAGAVLGMGGPPADSATVEVGITCAASVDEDDRPNASSPIATHVAAMRTPRYPTYNHP
jgi:hypothetical protein